MTTPAAPSDPPRRTIPLPTGPAAYTDEGDGPRVVVALHGLPGSARDFRWLAPPLTAGARLVRLDLPGFGGTPVATAPDPSPLGRARFALAVLDALALERPILLGHSMGGLVATAAAGLAPERLRGLALISSPGLRPHPMLRRFPARALSWLLSRPRVGDGLRPAMRWFYAQGGFKGYPDHELYRTVHCLAQTSFAQHAGWVRRLALPTLVAWCEDDPLIPPDIYAELAAACPPGPRLRFPDGGHNPQKTHATEIAAALLGWPADAR